MPDQRIDNYHRTNYLESFFFVVITIFICAWYILPSLKLYLDYTAISFILILYFFIFSIKLKLIDSFLSNVLIWSILLGLMHTLFGFPMNIKKGLWVVMTQFLTFTPFLIFLLLNQRKFIWELIIVGASILFLYIYMTFTTVSLISINPNLARFMTSLSVSDNEIVRFYQLKNVGGFGFSYALAMIVVFFWSLIINSNAGKIMNVILVILLVSFLYYILNAQFAILLIATLIMLFYTTVRSLPEKRLQLILGLSISLLIINLPALGYWLTSIYEGTTIGVKLNILLNSDLFDLDRIILYKDSFLLFTESPIWGNDVTGINYNTYNASHSTVLSLLSSTGLLGLLFYFLSFYYIFFYIMRLIGKESLNKFFIPLMVYFFLISLINPTFELFELYIILFLFAPIVTQFLNYHNQISRLKKFYHVRRMEV